MTSPSLTGGGPQATGSTPPGCGPGLGCPCEAALALYDASQDAALREALRRSPASAPRRLLRSPVQDVPARHPLDSAAREHPRGLALRGREVLDLICAGHTTAEIGAKLLISTKTVDHHVCAVLAKLDPRPVMSPRRMQPGSGSAGAQM